MTNDEQPAGAPRLANKLASQIKHAARRLGFDHCRILPVTDAPHADLFAAWIAQGRAGEMTYLERNLDARRQPALLVDSDTPVPRSIIVVAVDYHQFDLPPARRDDPSRGIIASYAWGDDYHEIMRPLLYALDAFIRTQTKRSTPGKCLVDTGPVLERDWAHQAGIGFTGKNCCTIHPQVGSWLLLATLLIPEVVDYDPPPQPVNAPRLSAEAVISGLPAAQNYGSWSIVLTDDHESTADDTRQTTLATCGQCTRCLGACPTEAFVGPYHLDPQRCISYWTIEAKGAIPRELRRAFGNRIFGCDICQEVCPYNSRLPERTPLLAGLRAQHDRIAPPLLEGFDPLNPYWLEPAAFSKRFRRSPIKRAKRHGMLRNVCVALGNWANPAAVAPLRRALDDPEALVRGHAAWALGEIGRSHPEVRTGEILHARLAAETDAWVVEEIQLALQIAGARVGIA